MVVEHHEPLATKMPADQAASKKKKRSKSGERPDRIESQAEMQSDKKEKKRKSKGAEHQAIEQTGDGVEQNDTGKRQKRKRKLAEQAADVVQEEEETAGTTRTKRQKRVKSKSSEERPIESEEKLESETKIRRKKTKSSKDGAIAKAAGDVRKKKRKHETSMHGFKDPAGDESLSEQASKALMYAYIQVDDTSRWKFNKARQNWLIRNIWSDEAIPSEYAPLVIHYLATVKGGAREALVQSCQTALAGLNHLNGPESTVQSNAQTEEGNVSIQTTAASDIQKERARELLEILANNIAP